MSTPNEQITDEVSVLPDVARLSVKNLRRG